MGPTDLPEVRNRHELRARPDAHHRTERECRIVCRRGRPSGEQSFGYADAVEEALCFGWIGSTIRKPGDGTTAQRLSPHRRGSSWSAQQGAVPQTRKTGTDDRGGPARTARPVAGGIGIAPDIAEALHCDETVWTNSLNFPPLYRRMRIDTIRITRKAPEPFRRRLRKPLDMTGAGVMYGDRNDYGRLSDY